MQVKLSIQVNTHITRLTGKTWNMRKPKTRIIQNVYLQESFEKKIDKFHLTDSFENFEFNDSFEKNVITISLKDSKMLGN